MCLAALPSDYASDWSYRSGSGMDVEGAWSRTLGRPDVRIAIGSTGVLWDEPDLVTQAVLNAGELTGTARPRRPDGSECGGAERLAGYDCNGDGRFDITDYAGDPRITPRVPDECVIRGDGASPPSTNSTRLAGDLNRNCILDPGDLILLFSDGVDDDANGYTDDVSGWDFFANDNDPYDDARDGRGTIAARVAAAAANNGRGQPGICPGCSYIPLRVTDEGASAGNDLAQAIVYASDNGARVVAAPLTTTDHSTFARAALDYAHAKDILVVTGIGDTSSRRHHFPGVANHVLTVAGVRFDGDDPASTTTFANPDGCSGFGGQLDLVASTTGCSGDAAARIAGIAGLLHSAAADASVTLTAAETKQLLLNEADELGAAGFDERTGRGRGNAARSLDALQASRIPPEVELTAPAFYAPIYANLGSGPISIRGRAAAPRARSYDLFVQWAAGAEPPESGFRDIVVPLRAIPAATLSGGPTPLAQLDPAQIETGPDRAITLRVRAVAHYDGQDVAAEARRVVLVTNQKNGLDQDLLPGFPLALDASVEASPKLADIDGDGTRDIVVADSAGRLHVFVQRDGKPVEAPGFPYLTRPIDGLNGDLTSEVSVPSYAAAPAYVAGAQGGIDPAIAREAIVRAPAIADLDGDGRPDIVIATWSGTVYVVNAKGQDAPGWPRRLPLVPSCPFVPQITPQSRCADTQHRVGRGTSGAPVLADLDGDARPEVILGAFDGQLYVFDAGGALRPGFPVDFGARRITTPPAVVDLTGDGRPEIVLGTSERTAFALDANGRVLPTWPVPVPSIDGIVAAPVATDFESDGQPDLVLTGNGATPLLFPARGTPGGGTAAFFGSPSVGDVDQDGFPDVIVSGGLPTLGELLTGSSPSPRAAVEHAVTVVSGATGAALGKIVVDDFATHGDHAIADVSGDEIPEIITGTGGGFLHAADGCGREAPGFPKVTSGWMAGTPAIGDIDGDREKKLEIVAATRDGYLFAWSTRGTANGKVLWESFRHDNANTGNTATKLAQGSSERAMKPLVCDAPPAAANPVFDAGGGCACHAAPGPRDATPTLLALVAAFAMRRVRSKRRSAIARA